MLAPVSETKSVGKRERRVFVKTLIDFGLAAPGDEWRMKGRDGNVVIASVTNEGELKVGRSTFPSPSAAASAVRGGTQMNGWLAWKFKLGDRWVPISELRSRYRIATAKLHQ